MNRSTKLVTLVVVLVAMTFAGQAIAADSGLWVLTAFALGVFACIKAYQYLSSDSKVTARSDSFILVQAAAFVIVAYGSALLGGRLLLGVG